MKHTKGVILSLQLLDTAFKTFVKPVYSGFGKQIVGYKLEIPTADISLPKFRRRGVEARKAKQHPHQGR